MSILTLQEIGEKVENVLKKYAIAEVYLFGSYARGEAREDSDIDLLYISKGREFSLTQKYNMLAELEEALGRRVDLVSLRAFTLNERIPGTREILENVKRERERLYVAR